jgi:tRNA (guanine37-N1)-methyltransferase
MRFEVVTLFPEMFAALTDYGISSRAVKQGLVSLSCLNPRDFTTDKHRTVDDKPYGGGPGMLMKTEPLVAAITAAKARLQEAGPESGAGTGQQAKTIYLSPQGKPLNQAAIEQMAQGSDLILVCGRYQGIDTRVIDSVIDEEWSLGDFVLSGGELAAMALIDALIRLQPGALGDDDSALQDSFSGGLLHWPEYTRPSDFAGATVPEVLLSGDHKAIAQWREQQSLGITWLKRPDLLERKNLSTKQRELLDEFINEYNLADGDQNESPPGKFRSECDEQEQDH